MYKKRLKRVLDFIIALLGIIMAFPLMILLALLVGIALKGNPIFVQVRPGQNEQLFKIFKFRTMTNEKDEKGILLTNKDRMTKLGRFLRSISLDELPQLFNVLFGTMSLIGPRPLNTQYLSLYNNHQKRRHEVKPGITGWAQVNGRNAISWESKFDYDVWYVDHVSFLLDMKILVLTIKKVFSREGVNQEGQATVQRFKGTKE